MKLSESFRISWRAITGHKLRSTLTTLGIIIGIGAVIVFMVMGGGFEANVLGDIDAEEETSIQVSTQAGPQQFVSPNIYTETDATAIEEIEGVEYVARDASLPVTQLSYNEESLVGGDGFGTFDVTATQPERFETGLFEMVEGEPFSEGSMDEAVVNGEFVDEFGGDVTVGDEIDLSFERGEDVTVTVVGIVDDDTGEGIPPRVHVDLEYYDTTIETPDGTDERAYPLLLVDVTEFDELDSVQSEIEQYFETDSHAQELKSDDHSIEALTVEDSIDQFQEIINQIALLLGGIAAISLVVGSIGIANIMIVSVTERTREIGIMKAVGARKRDIIQLFLVESLILGSIGAVLGVLAGLGAGYLGVTLLGWPMAYPLNWIVIAVVVGVVVGIVSGLYPAWRAARVDPIEALRRE